VLLETDAFFRQAMTEPEFHKSMSTAEFHHPMGRYVREREQVLTQQQRSLLSMAAEYRARFLRLPRKIVRSA
jgi:deoxyhypusine synthase